MSPASVSSAAVAPGRLLDVDGRTFRDNFNRRPFIIRHHLADHPLFSLPRLVELSARLPDEHVKYNAGDVDVAAGLYKGPRTGLSVEQTIKRIEECRSWMVLKYAEQDPDYKQIMDRCLDEVQQLSEPIDPGMQGRHAFIFISSPGSTTPFHMDPEYSFLIQIRGRKTMSVLDPSDRSVLSEEALEGYFSVPSRSVKFSEEYYGKSVSYDLAPGEALHVPYAIPHWVKNGDEVSISFSITFRTRASERKEIVHRVNGLLRGRGLRPSDYGRSAMRDATKFNAYRAARRARRLLGISEAERQDNY